MARTPLGAMLIEQGRIDEIQLRSAIAHQSRWGGRIGEALVAMGFVTEQVMLRTLARQLGVGFLEIGRRQIPPGVLHLVPEKVMRSRCILPVALVGTVRGPLIVAFSDPQNLSTIDEVAFAAGMAVRPMLASPRDLEQAIARHLDGESAVEDPELEVDVPADPGPMRLVRSYWS